MFYRKVSHVGGRKEQQKPRCLWTSSSPLSPPPFSIPEENQSLGAALLGGFSTRETFKRQLLDHFVPQFCNSKPFCPLPAGQGWQPKGDLCTGRSFCKIFLKQTDQTPPAPLPPLLPPQNPVFITRPSFDISPVSQTPVLPAP